MEKEERRQLRLSGKGAAFGLVLAFLVTGILIPAVLRLPTWIAYEVVLVVWWLIWTAVLTAMLYRGRRVADDHQLPAPRSWLGWFQSKPAATEDEKKKAEQAQARSNSSAWGGLNFPGGDHEGCAWILGAILAVVALFFLLWFLIEVAIPLVLFLLYLVARGMLSQVVNDRHHCKGRLGRSLGWGVIWASIYVVPLAGAVWCVHFALAQGLAAP